MLVHPIRQVTELVRDLAHCGNGFAAHLRDHRIVDIRDRVAQFHLDQLKSFIEPLPDARPRGWWRRISAHRRTYLSSLDSAEKRVNLAKAQSRTRRASQSNSCRGVGEEFPNLLCYAKVTFSEYFASDIMGTFVNRKIGGMRSRIFQVLRTGARKVPMRDGLGR